MDNFEIEIDLITLEHEKTEIITMGRLKVEKKRDLSAKIKAFFTSIIDYKINIFAKVFLKNSLFKFYKIVHNYKATKNLFKKRYLF